MSLNLKPCPFCRGEAKTHACAELCNEKARIIYAGKYGVHCLECGVATPPHDSEEKAVEAWNKRAAIVPPCDLYDIVYKIKKGSNLIYPCVVKGLNFNADSSYDEARVDNLGTGKCEYFNFSSFGVDIFTTYAEAEKALAERRKKQWLKN